MNAGNGGFSSTPFTVDEVSIRRASESKLFLRIRLSLKGRQSSEGDVTLLVELVDSGGTVRAAVVARGVRPDPQGALLIDVPLTGAGNFSALELTLFSPSDEVMGHLRVELERRLPEGGAVQGQL